MCPRLSPSLSEQPVEAITPHGKLEDPGLTLGDLLGVPITESRGITNPTAPDEIAALYGDVETHIVRCRRSAEHRHLIVRDGVTADAIPALLATGTLGEIPGPDGLSHFLDLRSGGLQECLPSSGHDPDIGA